MSVKASSALRELARLHGVQPDYEDMAGRLQVVPPEGVLGVLRALGAPVDGMDDVPDALRERRRALASRRVEPVVVAWTDRPAEVAVRLPGSGSSSAIGCRLTLEDGSEQAWDVDGSRLAREAASGEGTEVRARLPLPGPLPTGYHRLRLGLSGEEHETLVIAAPPRVYGGSSEAEGRMWGVFCPLHALRRRSSWGAGDFSDLEALVDWVADQGGSLVATLPMLATAIGDAPSVSPYSPTSRLFWNEFYLDVARVPELARCEEARARLEASALRDELSALRGEPLVDYGRQMRLKRPVLEALADWFFTHEGGASDEFRRFLADHPGVEDYAAFMAAGERLGRRWQDWPEPLRTPSGPLAEAADPRAVRYHLYAQWQADRQLRALSEGARARGLAWYVDFPVGVDSTSFDVWRYRDTFTLGASVGCPPDPTFTRGQDWGFPPPHPDRQREAHYRYVIEAVRAHFRYANALRLDHVMGLHRLYWVPAGLDARSGAFVGYPAEELYAILSVESHRRGAWLVGENLGTVPAEVQQSLAGHGVRGMFVVQYELARPEPDRSEALRTVPRESVASVNTHDMYPFAAFWRGNDIADRLELGLLDAEGADRERLERDAQRRALVALLREQGRLAEGEEAPAEVLRACWESLAASPSRVVMLNLEDLWLETLPQNIPNTGDERPNWRRRLRHEFEDFRRMAEVAGWLRRVAELRRGAGPPASERG